MAIREIIKNKKYKIELFIGRNGSKKIMHYEIVCGGKKDAVLRENEIKLEIKNHTFVKRNDMTISDLMNEYMETNKDKWTPKYYNTNKGWIKNIEKSIGHVHLQDLNVKLLESFYSELRKATKEITDKETGEKKCVPKYADRTIQEHYVLLNGALNKAIKWDYITYNVNQKVEKPKVRKKEVECYSPEEVSQLLDVLKNETLKYQAIIYLALDSGMRRGELTGLTWDDIDLKNGTIQINKITQYIKELGIYEKETKNSTSDRKIYISNTTLNVLKQYKKEQLKRKLKLGNKWENSKRVFTTDYGADMHPDTPSKIFEKIIEKYNLKRIKFHALRHTSVSLMISKGIQVQIISKKAGHSSVQVTDSTYSHFFDDEFKKCADEMDDILQEAK